ncbi:hypothetical protein OKN36_09740 [Furfurilactobacillus sp. OKN36]
MEKMGPMHLFGRLVRTTNKQLTIEPLTGLEPHELRQLGKDQGGKVEFLVHDPRMITVDQRRKIYALLRDVDEFQGNYLPELTKAERKEEFCISYGIEQFSLSNCGIEIAQLFIDYLIGFCLQQDIPFATQTMDAITGDYALSYYGLKYRRCAICQRHADIAHIQSVGMGNNRRTMSHVGRYVMPLCRGHHMEQHRIGITTFMNKYQVKGVRVDQGIAEMLRLGDWHVSEGDENNRSVRS